MKKDKIKFTSFILSSTFCLLFAFNNCSSEVRFSSKVDSASVDGVSNSTGNNDSFPEEQVDESTVDLVPVMTPINPTDSINEVVNYCETLVKSQQLANITFEDPGVTCDFGNNENLVRRDRYFQGRIEQAYALEQLPENAIICDLNFEFSEQEMIYDDHFLFAFDGSVIASSYDFNDRLQSIEGLQQYNWAEIAGMEWLQGPQYEGVFCPGQEDGMASCSWPQTDTVGTIALDYDSQLIQKVMGLNADRLQHEFRFITIGDNDDRDCAHSSINFQVNIEYVVPQ